MHYDVNRRRHLTNRNVVITVLANPPLRLLLKASLDNILASAVLKSDLVSREMDWQLVASYFTVKSTDIFCSVIT